MVGFGETYFPAFGLLLGASPFQVGLLTTVPMLCGAGAQLLAPRVAHRVGDRRFVIAAAVAQGLCFLPIGLLTLAPGGERYLPLLFWVALYWMLALGIHPVWNSWIGRIVPPVVRSRFFGVRGAAVNAALLASTLLAGAPPAGFSRCSGWRGAAAWSAPDFSPSNTIRGSSGHRAGRRCWRSFVAWRSARTAVWSRCWCW